MTEPSQRIGMHLGFHHSTIHCNLYSEIAVTHRVVLASHTSAGVGDQRAADIR
jgi:hypothetical protein